MKLYKELYFVLTPLHLLIIDKIIKDTGSHIVCIVHGNANKAKIIEQLEKIRLKHHCTYNFLELPIDSGLIGKLKSIYNVLSIESMTSERVYVSTIDSVFLHMIFDKKLKYKELYTYDDGTANIVKSSIYYIRESSFNVKLMRRIFRVKSGLSKFKKETLIHYTIFDPEKISNIVEAERCNYLKLYEPSFSRFNLKRGRVSVFLGTVYHEVFKFDDVDIFRDKILHGIAGSCDFYLPHPREDISGYSEEIDGKVIYTDDIAELYILKLVEIYQSVCVYGVYSTALLNLNHISSVNCFSVLIDRPSFKEYNDIFSKNNVGLISVL